MRSIIFYLADTSRDLVAAHLSSIAEPAREHCWTLPRASVPELFIDYYDDLEAEAEPGELAILESALGTMPDVSLVVNVSGRIAGGAEIKEVCESLLGAFRGVVRDNYTDHFWTLAEIQSGTHWYGHPFFDYLGWYKDEQGYPGYSV